MDKAGSLYKRYFYSIDGLRFIASVNIILYHFEKMGAFNNLGGKPAWFFTIIKGPIFHASLFFVLAGFLFTVKFGEHVNEFSQKKFIKSRLRDLYPLHIVSTLMMIPFIFLSGNIDIPKLFLSLFLHLSFLWPFVPYWAYSLNTPSWALDTFFICYLFFGFALKFIASVNSKRVILALMAIHFLFAYVAFVLYSLSDNPEKIYYYFHMSPIYRFGEFFAGMLVARLFQIRDSSSNRTIFDIGIVNDAVILFLTILIFLSVKIRHNFSLQYEAVSYHVILPIFFTILLYRFAKGNGLFAKLFAFKLIRGLGKSSFYPYLLHIPVASWICFVLEKFGYYTFLHSSFNVGAMVIFMYVLSYFYIVNFRKRKKTEFRK